MTKYFKLDECEDLYYYGNSDLLAQLARELACRPDSCISTDVLSWYNSLYSELSEFDDCRYRVTTEPPSSLEDAIDLLLALVQGQNRRVARAAIRIICRETLRQITLDLSDTP